MKNLGTFLVISMVMLSFGMQRAKAQDDEDAIRVLEQHWQNAFKAKDAPGIMKFYEPGAKLVVFDVVPPRQYIGYEAYQKDWQDLFAMFDGPVTFQMSDLDIITNGSDLAYSHSIQHVAGKLKEGGNLNLTVRVTDVYRKTGGKWMIAHEHVSVPVDIKTGKADLQSKP